MHPKTFKLWKTTKKCESDLGTCVSNLHAWSIYSTNTKIHLLMPLINICFGAWSCPVTKLHVLASDRAPCLALYPALANSWNPKRKLKLINDCNEGANKYKSHCYLHCCTQHPDTGIKVTSRHDRLRNVLLYTNVFHLFFSPVLYIVGQLKSQENNTESHTLSAKVLAVCLCLCLRCSCCFFW